MEDTFILQLPALKRDASGCGGRWQEEEDALAAAAAAEEANFGDRWQEGGLNEAEAMDFDGDYDDDGGMPDS